MKISCIIPAYNEEERVEIVIRAIVGHELVDEVIVVNDASTDGTNNILEKEIGIKLITHEKNQGKSVAVMHGLQQASNDIVMLIDADLVGLDQQSIRDLILPVMEDQADMTMSLRKNSLGIYKFLGLDFVSGERVFNKNIIGNLEKLGELSGYELEVFLNNILIKNKLRLKVVYWNRVSITLKQKKIGWRQGVKGDFYMIKEIISSIGLGGIIGQVIKMLKLKV